MNDPLDLFVREALVKGVGRDQIHDSLLEAGWPEDEVGAALDAYAEGDFPVPVPRPKPYVSARDAFVYLVLFGTLYTSAVAWIELVYQFINRAFPDSAQASWAAQRSLGTIRWSTACLIIAFPLFVWLSRRAYLAIRRDPEKRTSKVRKWLTYLTLFFAASALLCDVITLVFYLLGGELSVRFLLKVLTVSGVAGAVFGYYLWDLRQDDPEPKETPASHPGLRAFVGSVIVLVVASVVGGVVLAGSPSMARSQRFDSLRVHHLAGIANAIDIYWNRKDELPMDLETLSRQRGVGAVVRDPQTQVFYEYSPGEGGAYEICAVFDGEDPEPEVYLARGERFWAHGSGRRCFVIEVKEWE